MLTPLLIAMSLPGATVLLSSVRLVWIRRKVNVVRLSLPGVSGEQETARLLRLEALYLASRLGRIVRLDNLDSRWF